MHGLESIWSHRCRKPHREPIMLKDVVVNLALDTPPDVAADFAICITAAFDAHLTGIAFFERPSPLRVTADAPAPPRAANNRMFPFDLVNCL